MADILGTAGDDVLTGTTDPDVITGGDGNDTIDGNFGSDIINGGAGDDDILGAPGSDELTGGAGNDILRGGNGADTLNGTDAAAAGANEVDTLTGNGGSDIFILGDADQAYYTAAGAGDYAIITDFNPNQETVQLKGIPSDYTFVQNGDDAELYLVEDNELVAVFQDQDVAALDLDSSTFTYVGSGLDVVGTAGDDIIEGGDGFDIIAGGEGNDTINGGDGRDTLSGDAGDDTINGGDGNDTINGGDNNDTIDAGAGNDTVDGGVGDDTIIGGAGDDTLLASPGFDTVVGGAGNDTINGGGQDDILNGTDGTAMGAGEIDVIDGGGGADRFILGDENGAYYTAAGDADYVQIDDFDPDDNPNNTDVIQLYGEAADYSLVEVGESTEIRYNGELVAIVTVPNPNAPALDLNSAQFDYVERVNTAPVAMADAVSMDEDTVATIAVANLLSNDTDVDNDVLTVSSVSNAVNGTVSLDGESVIFTPDADFFGKASFDYTISDGQGGESTATVAVTVNDVPDNVAPVAVADTLTTDEDTSVTVTEADLLSNDTDADGDDLSLVSVDDATNGTVTLDEAGDVIFTPDAGFFGEASFDYTISDGQGGESTTTVAVTVNEVIEPVGETIVGTARHDILIGGDGDDTLIGGEGSDRLFGGAGNDILNGTGNRDQGRWERDILRGGEGADTFVLGDANDAYYTGSFWFDYALIRDFNSAEDTLQLNGSADDYGSISYGSTTYLYQERRFFWFSLKDVVAVVQGDQVDLQSSAVEFVG